jgi:glutamate/tyrosine decarboxylase-like PLP-dependent enzyme
MDADLAALRRQLVDPLPHPDTGRLRELTGQVTDWVLRHHATLPEQRIGQTLSRPEMQTLLGGPPPEEGRDFADVLGDFERNVAPYAFRVNHPRFFAFIPGAPTFVSALGDMLCAGTNFFAGVWLEGCGPAQIEIQVLRWFADFLGMPAETRGLLTSGGSEANLTALAVARDRLSYEDRGRAVLYLTEQRHGSMDRAAKVIGLRPDQLRPVPADDGFRLDLIQLAEAVRLDGQAGRLPWALAANAGATNTGTVDPLNAAADVCRAHGLWFHVDAAYGWPAVLAPAERAALRGVERADSVTLDPHKWFGQTFEAGCLLVRDGRRLPETFTSHPDYLQDVLPAEDEVNFADYGIALTRRFKALKVWLSVQVLGLGWYRGLVERCCLLADFAQAILQRSGQFEILCPRQLSIVCFRYVPPGPPHPDSELDLLNTALVDALRVTGRAFISSTRLRGQVALRFCFVNWRTTAADVEEVVRLLLELGPTVPGALVQAR